MNKPKMTRAEVESLIAQRGIRGLCVVGIRGYYKNSMGVPGKNDRGIYDDAIFVIGPDCFASFNANTDPSSYRKGTGTGAKKGMASLKAGTWNAHMLGKHKGKYMALIQTGGEVTVVRDGNPPYEDTGWFGINIHKGGYNSTSSAGCQTIHPDQWAAFISLVQKEMHEAKLAVMPYVLIEA